MNNTVYKKGFLISLSLIVIFFSWSQSSTGKKYEVAVYYFPNYHRDPLNEKWHGKGWTEWDLVKAAKPRFEGHLQPKIPTWGYFDESDPNWSAREIGLAADNGIDIFIYDWYWYQSTGPYLQDGLEKGFLKASNNRRLKFALMWANHDWMNIHPASYTNVQEKLTDGRVPEQTWDTMTSYIITHYFNQPNYWKIDGKPYFSIFLTTKFIESFGSLEKAAAAMKMFEDKVKEAGFPGLHLNCIDQGITDHQLEASLHSAVTTEQAMQALDASSISSYNFLFAYDLSKAGWPTASYQKAIEANTNYWISMRRRFTDVVYFPNVTMGWDVTPRLTQTDKFDSYKGYPWTPVFNGDNTPQAFRSALLKAKQFLDDPKIQTKIVILNAWNEWTEGSYLLPEKRTGTKYLEAINDIFGKR